MDLREKFEKYISGSSITNLSQILDISYHRAAHLKKHFKEGYGTKVDTNIMLKLLNYLINHPDAK